MKKLTEEELKILSYLCKGLNNSEIAQKVYKSVHTVKVYVSAILKKLNAKNRTAAVYNACLDKEIMACLRNEINKSQE